MCWFTRTNSFCIRRMQDPVHCHDLLSIAMARWWPPRQSFLIPVLEATVLGRRNSNRSLLHSPAREGEARAGSRKSAMQWIKTVRQAVVARVEFLPVSTGDRQLDRREAVQPS